MNLYTFWSIYHDICIYTYIIIYPCMDGHQVSPQDARNAWFPASSFPRSSQQADWRLQSPSLGFTGIQGQKRWADKTYHIHSYSRLNLSMSSRKSTETNEVVKYCFLQFHARSSGIGKGFEPTYTFQDRSEHPNLEITVEPHKFPCFSQYNVVRRLVSWYPSVSFFRTYM